MIHEFSSLFIFYIYQILDYLPLFLKMIWKMDWYLWSSHVNVLEGFRVCKEIGMDNSQITGYFKCALSSMYLRTENPTCRDNHACTLD